MDCGDLSEESLQLPARDLIICKDTINHMSTAKAMMLLDKIMSALLRDHQPEGGTLLINSFPNGPLPRCDVTSLEEVPRRGSAMCMGSLQGQ